MAFTNDWDESKPEGTENANLTDDYLRQRVVDLGERLESMFYGFNTDDATGAEDLYGCKHVRFREQGSDPTVGDAGNDAYLYTKNVSDVSELFVKNNADTVKQLTSGGAIKNVAGDYGANSIDEDDIRLANNAALTARNQAGDGDVNLIKAGTNNLPTLPDSSEMASNAAPVEDEAITNKKYVDDNDVGVVQVVNSQDGATAACDTKMPYDDSIPQKTEGVEVMTLAITPTSATNKLKIDVVVFGSADNSDDVSVALFQDDTAGALAAGGQYVNNTDKFCGISFTHYMTAGTTDETTFKVRMGGNAQNADFNGISGGNRKFGGKCASSITITEIKV